MPGNGSTQCPRHRPPPSPERERQNLLTTPLGAVRITAPLCWVNLVASGFTLTLGALGAVSFARYSNWTGLVLCMLWCGLSALDMERWWKRLRRVRREGPFVEAAASRRVPMREPLDARQERLRRRGALGLLLPWFGVAGALWLGNFGVLRGAALTGVVGLLIAGFFLAAFWYVHALIEETRERAARRAAVPAVDSAAAPDVAAPSATAPGHWWTESGTRAEVTEPVRRIGGRER